MIATGIGTLMWAKPLTELAFGYGDAGTVGMVLGFGLLVSLLGLILNSERATPRPELVTTRPALQH
ncbi:MAG: hypothetical protein HYR72_23635 [Deltaproteobacteria bacterium]|nr:hypothetical protein [Deltaproteobacteria bacterium]MBI3389093.1 hypothetical protein [Deltaproteobacteria bacterium]